MILRCSSSVHAPRRFRQCAACWAILLAAACGGSAPEGAPLEPAGQVRRVVSLVPALTEMTFALGEGDRLVGVSDYCKYPPEALEKPRVGALINLDYEHLLSLQPDCVLLRPEQEEMARRLGALGVASVRLPLNSIAESKAAILRLGDLYGCADKAIALRDSVERELADARSASRRAFGEGTEPDGADPRPTVLFVVGRNPGTLQQLYAAGTGSFLDELISAAGGRNVLEGTALPWPVVSKESILALDPDVIFDSAYISLNAGGDAPDPLLPWQQLSALRAVREGRIIALDDEHMMIPGPAVGEAAVRLSEYLRAAFPERLHTGTELEAAASAPGAPDAGPQVER